MARQRDFFCVFFLLCISCIHLITDVHIAKARLNLPPVEAFILKWTPSGGSELGSSQSFLNELCDLLDVPRPSSPRAHVPDNTYTFEKSVEFVNPETGKKSYGRIDLYKRGCFIWESKQGSDRKAEGEHGPRRKGTAVRDTKAWDKAMLDAKAQGERYARSLHPDEGKPPFLIVSDIGHVIEVYADFNGVGTYTPFPSAKEHRITLEDLRKPHVLAMFKRIWTNPLILDAARGSAKVTRELAVQLADLATDLEESGHEQGTVSLFLMRCIFTMFAEDVGLVEYNAFTDILTNTLNNPDIFVEQATDFWQVLRITGDAYPVEEQVLRFQGYLFDNVDALPLTKKQVALLHRAAHAHWAAVDTAIFGYLLERALDPTERHALGAHYTPTAYVERLVVPTVMEPLREQWHTAQEAVLAHVNAGKHEAAVEAVHGFHKDLSEVTVLDPSCGSGVFLAVTLSLLKELEAEVVQALRDMGLSETQIVDRGYAVNPRQFKGIEVVPRAVDISELVLWLTYLQKHYAIHGKVNPKETLFGNVRSVELRDAVLLYRGNGTSAQSDVWPQADYIVGNPPFVGGSKMNEAFGMGYTNALRQAYPMIAASSDYVMYWWYRAAKFVQDGKTKRFGFITTSTINQLQNRGVMELFLESDRPLSIVYAVPSHPWHIGGTVWGDGGASSGASVRIAMTVVEAGIQDGVLATVIGAETTDGRVRLSEERGKIHATLSIGVDFSKVQVIEANKDMAFTGVSVNGTGFIVTQEEARRLGLGTVPGLEKHMRPYLNGRDIMGISRDVMVIDMYGLPESEVKARFPLVYQWLLENVKPERETKSNARLREEWWLFERPRPAMRNVIEGLPRYIVTSRTAKHRVFTFVDRDILPDAGVVAIATDDAYILGILSSRIHREWAEAVGSRMKNDFVYIQKCFDTFPLLECTEEQKQKIRDIAARLDAHRKEVQKKYPKLTLTALYNVLELVQDGESLTSRDKVIFEQGNVARLRSLHDELDVAVGELYGVDGEARGGVFLGDILSNNFFMRHIE